MVMTGKAKMIRNPVISVIQTNMGMRLNVMPGARMLMIVTMKLMEARIDETPRIWSPNAQKSTACVSANSVAVSGA